VSELFLAHTDGHILSSTKLTHPIRLSHFTRFARLSFEMRHASLGAGQLDSRLYNQSEGLDSGFGKEDEYNTYTKPLFDRDQAAKSVYRPTRGENDIGDADEQIRELQEGAGKRFKPDVGFAGTDTGGRSQQRDAPVQFEYGLSKNKGDEKGEENK